MANEHITELAAELALGTISGDERADALHHLAGCSECRKLVLELTTVTDSLLELAPAHEPPVGFESRVISTLDGPGPRRRRGWIMAAAASLAAAIVAATGVLWLTAKERDSGRRYLAALERADGDYFAVYELYDPNDSEIGHVFAYEGETPWLYLVMDEEAPGGYEAEVVTERGRTVAIRRFELVDGQRGWGTVLPVGVGDVEAFRMTSETGETYASPFEIE